MLKCYTTLTLFISIVTILLSQLPIEQITQKRKLAFSGLNQLPQLPKLVAHLSGSPLLFQIQEIYCRKAIVCHQPFLSMKRAKQFIDSFHIQLHIK